MLSQHCPSSSGANCGSWLGQLPVQPELMVRGDLFSLSVLQKATSSFKGGKTVYILSGSTVLNSRSELARTSRYLACPQGVPAPALDFWRLVWAATTERDNAVHLLLFLKPKLWKGILGVNHHLSGSSAIIVFFSHSSPRVTYSTERNLKLTLFG